MHRTTGVDCAWLEETLPTDMQAQYDQFETEQLGRWFVDGKGCSYFLCATGDALFGGKTTRIKSSLLLTSDLIRFWGAAGVAEADTRARVEETAQSSSVLPTVLPADREALETMLKRAQEANDTAFDDELQASTDQEHAEARERVESTERDVQRVYEALEHLA